jgi:ribosomal protein S18 acetylase RimI-like enzyme
MKIRRATSEDSSSLKALDTVIAVDPGRTALIETWLSKDTVVVAELNSEIVGYAVFNHAFFHRGQVDMLMIHADHRGKRIGEHLLKAIENLCDSDKLFVTTNLSNQRMQKLLTRVGYRTCGSIDELDPGDPELVFVKGLKAT